jgi:hypothetical protein
VTNLIATVAIHRAHIHALLRVPSRVALFR